MLPNDQGDLSDVLGAQVDDEGSQGDQGTIVSVAGRNYDLSDPEQAQALANDYTNLNSEFTKKSQRLAELEKGDDSDGDGDAGDDDQGYWQDQFGLIHDAQGNIYNQAGYLVQSSPSQGFGQQSDQFGPGYQNPQGHNQLGQGFQQTPEYQQAAEMIAQMARNAGFMTKDDFEAIQFAEHLDALAEEIDGSDGRPPFEADKIMAYMQREGIRNPNTAYKLMNEDALTTWRLNEAQKQGGKIPKTITKTSPSGPRVPTPTKIPNLDSSEFQGLVKNMLEGGTIE